MIDDFFTSFEDLEESFMNDDDPLCRCQMRHLKTDYGELIPIQTDLFNYVD